MNSANFQQWVNKQLLPNIPAKSVLVIDNAPYHNVKVEQDPNSNTKKNVMINWLEQRNIPHDPTLTKPELYCIIKEHKPRFSRYRLDTLLSEHKHNVLRLPPYHPEFNPIEKIWAIVKNWVAARNTTFKMADVEDLAKQKFAEITPEIWSNVCGHVDKIVEEYLAKEHILDDIMDEFIINTGDSDESDSWSESEDDDGIQPLSNI